MAELQTGIPKKKLVELIVDNLPEVLIRQEFKIERSKRLRVRLNTFSKLTLTRFFLQNANRARTIMREFEQQYPIKQAPTLFLVRLTARPDIASLEKTLRKLVKGGRKNAIFFGQDKTVRAVYVSAPSKPVLTSPLVYEFEFAYEKKIVYTCAEPRSKNYGRTMALYSLESAIFWLPATHSDHAILCCGDFQAVTPIQSYASEKLQLEFLCPYLSLEMMKRIASTGMIRTATFTAHNLSPKSTVDARSVTISDPGLPDKSIFQSFESDDSRAQTAGFYSDHPDVQEAGVGISRRYARIWTPAILDRSGLIHLGMGIIRKVEKELAMVKQRDLATYISIFRNYPVYMGRKRLPAAARSAFDALVCAVWEAQRSKKSQEVDAGDILPELLRHTDDLRLQFRMEVDCKYCGTVLAACDECHSSQRPAVDSKGSVRLYCKQHCPANGREADILYCFCGEQQNIIEPYQHLFACPQDSFAHPKVELVDAITKFSKMARMPVDRLFVISGAKLRLLRENPMPALPPVQLQDLKLWSATPAINHLTLQNTLSESRQDLMRKYLSSTKEKCYRDGSWPNKSKCGQCLAVPQTAAQFVKGDLCLARLFGIPIDRGFDGIHHGREIADIIYQDHIGASPKPKTIAIHLKSRTRNRPEGLGRSVSEIKELYTQLFFLAYQVQSSQLEADVIGVSIPNTLHPTVKDSMLRLGSRLGIRLMFLEEPQWIAIADAALKTMETITPKVAKPKAQ